MQPAVTMEEQGLTKIEMAMKASRLELDRLFDPTFGPAPQTR